MSDQMNRIENEMVAILETETTHKIEIQKTIIGLRTLLTYIYNFAPEKEQTKRFKRSKFKKINNLVIEKIKTFDDPFIIHGTNNFIIIYKNKVYFDSLHTYIATEFNDLILTDLLILYDSIHNTHVKKITEQQVQLDKINQRIQGII